MDNETPRARLYYLFNATRQPRGQSWLARLPVGLFGIWVGLFGLTEAWHCAARHGWKFAASVDAVLVWPVTALWALNLALYLLKCARYPQAVLSEFRHPVHGSLMTLLPMSMLLAAINIGDADKSAWLYAVLLGIALEAAIAARVVGPLVTGQFPENAVTPALYLPIVGSCLVGGMALAAMRLAPAGMLLFGLGIAGWAMLEVRVMSRLGHGPLPGPARPTIGVGLVPPIVSTLAASVLWPGLPGEALLVALGVAFAPYVTVFARYHWWGDTPFSIGFWSFSFPLAALASVVLETIHRGGWPLWIGVGVLAGVTSILFALTLRTTSLLLHGRLLSAEE